MQTTEWFPDDLRVRLAAERAMEQKQSELAEANSKIAAHARQLTEKVIESRTEIALVKSEAETLRDENTEVRHDLQRAQSAIQIAERRLWESLETIEDGFAVFDTNNCLIAANRAFLAPFQGLEEIQIGVPFARIVRLAAEEGLVDLEGSSTDDWIAEMVARWNLDDRKPLTIRFFNDTFVRIIERRTRDGDMVLLVVDMTETMARARELDDARIKAEAASRAKSAFLANMSHEIRTPMNGVLAMTELLGESDLTADQRLYLDTIRNSGEALLVIINDVLDYSRIEAGKLALTPAPFDLEKCVNDVMLLLQPSAREKGIDLLIDYDMFLPTGFVGDQGRIRQVLTNLVGNAVKFTEAGHVLVRVVGLPAIEAGHYRIHIVVEDTGIGIPEDMRQHIFGEFNQVEDQMNRSFDGTGLGLAITKRLVGLMGGEVWLDSDVGKGSSFGFHITLPAARGGDVPEPDLPDWLGQISIIDPNHVGRALVHKQLSALGLAPEVFDGLGDVPETAWSPRDVVFIAASLVAEIPTAPTASPAAMFVLCQGPVAPDMDLPPSGQVLTQPFLRHQLRDRLANLPTPVVADPPPEPPLAEQAPPQTRLQVLAAEDNKTNQLVLKKLLSAYDIDLRIAENGRETVAAYREARPDILFTDISMPLMDGKDAAREIRAYEAAHGLDPIPIVAMTAHAGAEMAAEITAAGIDHCLTKPLRRNDLAEHLRSVAPEGELPIRETE
ncbi:MAG: ATP-binding protein [Pseudomonadota bacterium]